MTALSTTATTLDAPVRFAPPAIGQAEMTAVMATLQSGWLSTGPRVREFEEAFAEYVGAKHAIALNSCTAALHLSLLASKVGHGDEVVTTPLTFCATANTVIHTGATPVFADIDPITWNLSPSAASAAMTARTRAIIPVHYAGRPADMTAFRAIGADRNVAVIEDAAHAVETIHQGEKVGSTADFSCFSFYATKNLTTGEGGMVTTSSAVAADFIRTASLHGMSRDAWTRYSPKGSPHYDVVMPGFKYNMMDIQAAIGLRQLATIERKLTRRDEVFQLYDDGLAGLPIELPAPVARGDRHARHLYTIRVTPESGWTRDELAAALSDEGICTSVHFRALHLHPYYKERFGFARGQFPIAESVSDTILSLPMSAAITNGDVARVTSVMRRLLSRARRA